MRWQKWLACEKRDFPSLSRAKRRHSIPSEEGDLLARIAQDYYIVGRSQVEIAERLSISRSYVSRLLSRAREAGIVRITINHPVRSEPALEREIQARFLLQQCMVVSVASDDHDSQLQQAGLAASRYLAGIVRPEHTLAVSWGNGVKAVSEALPPGSAHASHVVQMFGGLTLATHDIGGSDLVGRIAHRLDATFDYLHAPWIVESKALAEALMGQPDVAGVLAKAGAADMALVGIGATGQGSSGLLFNTTYLEAAELDELACSGAVGDIAARSFDVDGRPCRLSFDDRIIGLDLEALQRIPVVVGIATGAHKAPALLAALRGRLINVLVTDRSAALAIVEG